jgi:hypothetical protein
MAAAATLRTVLALASGQKEETVNEAFAACQRYNNFSHRFFQGMLDRSTSTPPHEEPAWIQDELF